MMCSMRLWGWLAASRKSKNHANVEKRRQRGKRLDFRRRLLGEQLEGRMLLSTIGGLNPNEIINTSLTPTQLAESLVGTGVSVSNVTFRGGAQSTGSFDFTNAPTVVGFSKGILLSSGNAADVVGPNAADWTSTDWVQPGDADLDVLSTYPTYDAAVLEFDFIPTSNQVTFEYVFASDEYPEWVNTPFNDTFAFYVNGTNYANVRQIAGDPTAPFVPVGVNNINNSNPVQDPPPASMRPDLFRANYYDPNGGPSVIDLELDGITNVLTFQAMVNPGIVNHMKLAIADASDGIYDSAVFIRAGSLVSNENPVADLSLSPELGSAPLTVTAFIEGEDPNGLPLTYTINWGDGTPNSTGDLDQPPSPNEKEKTAQINHTYTDSGTYIVTLTVSNGTLSDVSTEDVEVLPTGQLAAPVVISSPTGQNVSKGELFTFSASASGVPTPNVQWQVSTDNGVTFVNISGAKSTTYTGIASEIDDGNQYRAVFTNSQGSATTVPALLHVSAEGDFAPVVTTDPADLEVNTGDLFSFTASASGVPTPSVQWQVKTADSDTFEDIPGAVTTTYSAIATLADDGSQYQAVFTNSEGSAITNPAELTISANPVDLIVTLDPVSQTVVAGDSFTFSAWAAGAEAVQWQLSTDNGATFDDIPGATATTFSAIASLSDNGNQYRAVFFADLQDDDPKFVETDSALLTVRPVAPGVALTQDTGSSSSDNVTKVGTLSLSGVETGATVQYSIDGGTTWSPSFSATEGLNTVLVRQTLVADNFSDATFFSFTLDTTPPKAPRMGLTEDTGSSSSDNITKLGTLILSSVESGASVEYSIDNGATWNSSFSAIEGLNTVLVRQTDLAGNVSEVGLDIFTLDTALPTAPGVALTQDTGSSTTDKITKLGTLTLSDLETAASVEYSTDDGATWSNSFTAVEASNTVLVRQTDVAGNISGVTTFSFTLDTTLPQLTPTFSQTQPFLVNAVGITVSANATDASGIVSESCGVVDTSTAGSKFVTCTATDKAGNRASVDVPYVVEYPINVSVTRGGFRLNRATGRYVQIVTLTNNGSTIAGPISLVLDNLSTNATLFNKTGNTTSANPPSGSPYIDMRDSNKAILASLASGASVQVVLEFANPTNSAITYTTRILAGLSIR